MARNLSSNGEGHNSGGMIDAEKLKQYVDLAGNLMRDQKALGEDIKELCAECDEAGVCSKKELRRRARESLMDPVILQAQLQRDAELRAALGMFVGTALGAAAVKREARPRGRPRKNPMQLVRDMSEEDWTSPPDTA